ncbi:MAG: PilZ domain-containing protein [Terriglobales bacterium]
MTTVDPKGEDRRRNPRFVCGGCATIYHVPFNGTSISASLRNVSVGGLCLDMASPVDPGARTEVVLRVNASSFRAAALVKGQTGVSGTSLEFVQISAGGKDVLEELLERLAKVQALNRRLRSSRVDEDTRRMLSEKKKFRVVGVGDVSRVIGIGGSHGAEATVSVEQEKAEADLVQPEAIEIDLFC